MIHKHILVDSDTILKEKRVDPITADPFKIGDEIVICASCKSAFSLSSWYYLNEKHCNQAKTLQHLEESTTLLIQSRIEPVLQKWLVSLRREVPAITKIILGLAISMALNVIIVANIHTDLLPFSLYIIPLIVIGGAYKMKLMYSTSVVFQSHVNSISVKGKKPISKSLISSISVRVSTDDPYFNMEDRQDRGDITRSLSKIEFSLFLVNGKVYEFYSEFVSENRIRFYTFLKEISEDIPVYIESTGVDYGYLSTLRNSNFKVVEIGFLNQQNFKKLKQMN